MLSEEVLAECYGVSVDFHAKMTRGDADGHL